MIQRKENLEDILAAIENSYDDGQFEKAVKELKRGRSRYPDNLTLMEWEAVFIADESRFREALEILDRVLQADPERIFALREKAAVLQGLGRFEDSLQLFEKLGPDGDEDAAYFFEMGVCLDRLKKTKEADRNFARAARINSELYQVPLRLDAGEFEDLVRQTLARIPPRFQPFLDNVIVTIEDFPSHLDADPFLLGLYDGVPRTERDQDSRNHLDRIVIYKRNLELEFSDRSELQEEIIKTVIHEVAHHFGMEEDEMGEYA